MLPQWTLAVLINGGRISPIEHMNHGALCVAFFLHVSLKRQTLLCTSQKQSTLHLCQSNGAAYNERVNMSPASPSWCEPIICGHLLFARRQRPPRCENLGQQQIFLSPCFRELHPFGHELNLARSEARRKIISDMRRRRGSDMKM